METIKIHDKSFQILIPETVIMERVKSLAETLNVIYEGKTLHIICVLNGSFIFTADLVRYLTMPMEIHFVRVSTYGNERVSSGSTREVWGLDSLNISQKSVLIAEDIIDTGFTLEFLRQKIDALRPESIETITFLFKPESFKGTKRPEYTGFNIPDDFVVGYGMDYAQMGRELRAIYQLYED